MDQALLTLFEQPVGVGPDLQVRLLPVDEWPRLAEASGPLSGHQLPADDTHARVVVLEVRETGQIVAYWVLAAMIHLDPLFIEPEYRHRQDVTLALLGLMVTTLQAANITYAYACVADEDQPGNGRLLEKLGFSPLPGTLYRGAIPPFGG